MQLFRGGPWLGPGCFAHPIPFRPKAWSADNRRVGFTWKLVGNTGIWGLKVWIFLVACCWRTYVIVGGRREMILYSFLLVPNKDKLKDMLLLFLLFESTWGDGIQVDVFFKKITTRAMLFECFLSSEVTSPFGKGFMRYFSSWMQSYLQHEGVCRPKENQLDYMPSHWRWFMILKKG